MKTLVTATLLTALGLSLTGCIVSPPMAVAPSQVGITVGWHGDRYYDGHRYWSHDEWMRSHPGDQGWHGQRADRSDSGHHRDDNHHDDDHQRY
ncbi:hypothetical protein [Paraburkholderia sp. J76]|uniref:hypothetical protein n=1 Tax=Paraburkholderia sp. J76 TaxID=2805439 RepID=UPI002ABDE0A9|nr:hypothetical protein [Paraburkholderia sp. J76]